MSNKDRILWIFTRTAIFIALLIVLQAVTAPLGNTLITGSVVNLMLIVSVITCGLASGLSVAVFSPVMAKLIGIRAALEPDTFYCGREPGSCIALEFYRQSGS